jgi:UDP-glucose 4-epimerase
MSDEQVVLVTGVAGYWGSRVAEQLLKLPGYRVFGLDTAKPQNDLPGLTFIESDAQNPLLGELFKGEAITTLCHLSFRENDRPSKAGFEQNVIGTMKILGACVDTGVRKIVLRSSTAVYGACAENSAFLTESHPFRGSHSNGYNRDLVAIETFCNGFRRQHPEIELSLLRFANIVGPKAITPMTRYLRDPLSYRLLGFDPMMQVIHEQDVVGSLVYSVVNDHPGAFNIAAEGVMPLTHLTNLAGKIPIPVLHYFAYLEVGLFGAGGLGRVGSLPIEPDFLRYPCVGDTTKMKNEMGFTPILTAEETLNEFAAQRQKSESGSVSESFNEDQTGEPVKGRETDGEVRVDTPVEQAEGD